MNFRGYFEAIKFNGWVAQFMHGLLLMHRVSALDGELGGLSLVYGVMDPLED